GVARVAAWGLACTGGGSASLVARRGRAGRTFEFGRAPCSAVRLGGVTPGMGQLLVGERDAQARIGQPYAAIRLADHIIGAVDPLALVAVHHDFAVLVVRPTGDAA